MDRSGERFVPQQADPYDEIAVEHMQRYQSLRELVRNKIVLDAGSGEGYGASILAGTALRVVGVDIYPDAVNNARATYQLPNLEYRIGSVDALPFQDSTFDVVVSFEVIEHLEEPLQAAFLGEARRVLCEQGILVISTPNKAVYSDYANHHNEFHKKEFYVDEFESFLRQLFPRVALFGQGWFLSSVMQQSSSLRFENLRPLDRAALPPKYVVAVCSAGDLADSIDLSSVVVDAQGKLEGMWKRIVALQEEVESKNAWVSALEEEIGDTAQRVLELQEEVEGKNAWIGSLKQEIQDLEQAVAHFKKEVAEFEPRLAKAHEHIASLDQHIAFLDRHIAAQSNTIKEREEELADIKKSDFWRLATSYWQFRDKWLPYGSRRRRVFRASFSLLKTALQAPARMLRRKSAQSAPVVAIPPPQEEIASPGTSDAEVELVAFDSVDSPKVSIIVPAFNQWNSTIRCMKSIRRTMIGVPCEIIIADDGSTDMTVRAGELFIGARLLRYGENRGFLRNCNRAASEARGKYLYFLNNDTELRPGAIQALVSLLDRDPTVGIAGSKLVYPNGRLQEAGGIIWADGSGWNFGKDQDPVLPAFNYLKDVDYISGASLMIRRDLWKDIGGFDERYAPAYCEDSDLAFETRKRGYRVVYQPQSVVVHYEGTSHGTDVTQQTKAYQVRNTEALRAKWAMELTHHFPNGTEVFHARDRSAGGKTILIIDHYIPQFDRDAGSRTIWSFIQAFLALGMNVKFLGDNFFSHQPYTDILQQAGVEVLAGPWMADHWREWLADNGSWIDFVFMNRPHIAPKYLRSVRANTKSRVLYYVHDLHYLRDLQMAELKKDPALKVRAQRAKIKEQELMRQMDVIFSCSDTEAAMIGGSCPGIEVHQVPAYSVDVDLTWDFRTEERAGLLFVGGFSHPPNADAALWFVRDIWPKVKEHLPGAVFRIAGAAPPQEVLSLASDDVRVLGFVSDEQLAELYRASRLVVIPLRYGAGVKGKTVEAMAHGVPVVCTSWGVEGMTGVEEILDPLQFRAPLETTIAALYHDPSRLTEISRREREYVARHYNLDSIREVFLHALAVPGDIGTPGSGGNRTGSA